MAVDLITAVNSTIHYESFYISCGKLEVTAFIYIMNTPIEKMFTD